jgi:hypothetical protein
MDQSWLVSQPTVAGFKSTASPSVTCGASTPFASYLALLLVTVVLQVDEWGSWRSVTFTSPVDRSVTFSCKYSFWMSSLDVNWILLSDGGMVGGRAMDLICTARTNVVAQGESSLLVLAGSIQMGYSKEGLMSVSATGGGLPCLGFRDPSDDGVVGI